jgi:hypothetical protein
MTTATRRAADEQPHSKPAPLSRWRFELPREFPPEVVDEFTTGLARILVAQALRADAVRAVTDDEARR